MSVKWLALLLILSTALSFEVADNEQSFLSLLLRNSNAVVLFSRRFNDQTVRDRLKSIASHLEDETVIVRSNLLVIVAESGENKHFDSHLQGRATEGCALLLKGHMFKFKDFENCFDKENANVCSFLINEFVYSKFEGLLKPIHSSKQIAKLLAKEKTVYVYFGDQSSRHWEPLVEFALKHPFQTIHYFQNSEVARRVLHKMDKFRRPEDVIVVYRDESLATEADPETVRIIDFSGKIAKLETLFRFERFPKLTTQENSDNVFDLILNFNIKIVVFLHDKFTQQSEMTAFTDQVRRAPKQFLFLTVDLHSRDSQHVVRLFREAEMALQPNTVTIFGFKHNRIAGDTIARSPLTKNIVIASLFAYYQENLWSFNPDEQLLKSADFILREEENIEIGEL